MGTCCGGVCSAWLGNLYVKTVYTSIHTYIHICIHTYIHGDFCFFLMHVSCRMACCSVKGKRLAGNDVWSILSLSLISVKGEERGLLILVMFLVSPSFCGRMSKFHRHFDGQRRNGICGGDWRCLSVMCKRAKKGWLGTKPDVSQSLLGRIKLELA